MTGHEHVRAELERDLPPVTLLLGPPGTGKKTLAMRVAQHHGSTVSLIHAEEKLTALQARGVVQLAQVSSALPRFFVLCLDGAAEQAQNILLKVLEEPPPAARFILTASVPPLPTIVSRARVYQLGLLTDEQVAGILATQGTAPAQARQAALRARGMISAARSAAGEDARIRSAVAAAAKAAKDGNVPVLDEVMRHWGAEHEEVLWQWALEAASGRHILYPPGFATLAQARRLLEALTAYRGSRVASRVALAAAFSNTRWPSRRES